MVKKLAQVQKKYVNPKQEKLQKEFSERQQKLNDKIEKRSSKYKGLQGVNKDMTSLQAQKAQTQQDFMKQKLMLRQKKFRISKKNCKLVKK